MFFIPSLEKWILNWAAGRGLVKKSAACRDEEIGSSLSRPALSFSLTT